MPKASTLASAFCAAAWLSVLTPHVACAAGNRVWFAPLPVLQRPNGQEAGAVDFNDLFRPDADWGAAGQRIGVFKIYGETLRHASDAQIADMASALRRRGVRLALELPVLTGACGGSSVRQAQPARLADRLARLHVRLDLLAMVGPLVDGVVNHLDGACRSPQDVARDAAASVDWIRRSFPAIEVGEIEPAGAGAHFPEAAQLPGWIASLSAAGVGLAFLHQDVSWESAWQAPLRGMAAAAAQAGIAFGVIANSSRQALSDAAASSEMRANLRAAEQVLGGPPQDIVFQSWEDYPRHVLPAVAPDSMLGAASAGLVPVARFIMSGARVRLVDENGAAIGGAPVSLEQPETSAVPGQLSGTVPHGARQVLAGVRLHRDCVCAADAIAVTLSALKLAQPGGTNALGRVGGGNIELMAASGETRLLNTAPVPVAEDQPFTLSYRLQVKATAERSGFLALIFLDRAGVEMRRSLIWLGPQWRHETRLTADTNGAVAVPSLVGPRRLVFAGGAGHGAAILEVGW